MLSSVLISVTQTRTEREGVRRVREWVAASLTPPTQARLVNDLEDRGKGLQVTHCFIWDTCLPDNYDNDADADGRYDDVDSSVCVFKFIC